MVTFGLENHDPVANQAAPGHTTIATSDFTIDVASTLNPKAFYKATIDFYSCNPATTYVDYEKYEAAGGGDVNDYLRSAHSDFKSMADLLKYNSDNKNLLSTIAEVTKSKATGYVGSTSYLPVGNGKPPGPGKTFQTVNGQPQKSVSVTVDKREGQ